MSHNTVAQKKNLEDKNGRKALDKTILGYDKVGKFGSRRRHLPVDTKSDYQFIRATLIALAFASVWRVQIVHIL